MMSGTRRQFLSRVTATALTAGCSPRSFAQVAEAPARRELPPLPTRGKVVFSDNLLAPDFASDSGFRQNGKPCWRSRLERTRQQVGNREAGYYADPTLNPEVKVWGIEPATGCRFIQAEHVPGGLSDNRGGQIMQEWQKTVPFTYTGAIITSQTLFNRIATGSYVEFDVKLSKIAGTWPALWLLRSGMWPPEIDVMEAFISSFDYPLAGVATNVHWMSNNVHQSASAPIKLDEFEPDADIFSRFNRFGCFLGKSEIVWYFNGKPYRAASNSVGSGPWYMLMDVAVGGLVAAPPNPSAFPARMYIREVKVVQFS
ncbi:glycoside hydrolase family 16 protein [Bradyrhizobium sp. USDA 4471]